MKAAWGVTKFAGLTTVFTGGVGLLVAPGLTVGGTLLAGATSTLSTAGQAAGWIGAKAAALAPTAVA